MNKEKSEHYSLISRFVSLVILAFFSMVFCFIWKIEHTRSKVINESLKEVASDIHQSISNDFYHIGKKMHLLASQIASDEFAIDNKKVLMLSKLFSIEYKMNECFPIVCFDKNHFLKRSGFGVIKQSKDINFLMNFPLKLYTVSEDQNILELDKESGFIYLSMGVKRKKDGAYLGQLRTGISLEDFRKKFFSNINIKDNYIHYILLNTQNNMTIFSSANTDRNTKKKLFNGITNSINNKENKIFNMKKGENYVISKIPHSPFVLIVAATSSKSYEEYFYSILEYKLELLILIIISCSFIYLLYISILHPFLKLSEAVFAISDGDLEVEIPIVFSKEGILIADSLRKIKMSLKEERNLIQEVTQARNALSLTNLRLENKVTDRTEELKKALAEKTLFINNLSHEIKTPLQAVSNILENLVSYWSEVSEENKFKFVNQASYSVQYLASIVENLLDIAKFSGGKIILNLKNTNITELAKEVIEECKILYTNNKQVRITFLDEQSIYANVDKSRIGQVLRNLILNAIKFSNINGLISVKISLAKIFIQEGFKLDAVQISINDQGVGIPEDELANIFSPFVQGSNVKNKSLGTGLGLTICHEIINAHCGKIWAENNKDEGASFNFILPITQPIELVNNIHSSISLNNSRYNILMIDDEEVCLNSMEMLLYGSEYNLIKISSAQFALQYLKENSQYISVIFIDLMMPDIYGLNLLSTIKEDPDFSSIPIILQTSSSDESEILKAFEKGIFSFITKPYQKNKLLDEIRRAILASRKINDAHLL